MMIFNNKNKIQCRICGYKIKKHKAIHLDSIPVCENCIKPYLSEKSEEEGQVDKEKVARIITTTTNNIDGYYASRYFTPISSTVIMGIITWDKGFKIFTPSKGRIIAVESELSSRYDFAIQDLKRKAFRKGANAILGINFNSFYPNFGETSLIPEKVSILTATGTPVSLQRLKQVTK